MGVGYTGLTGTDLDWQSTIELNALDPSYQTSGVNTLAPMADRTAISRARDVARVEEQADGPTGQQDQDAGDLERMLRDIEDLLEFHAPDRRTVRTRQGPRRARR